MVRKFIICMALSVGLLSPEMSANNPGNRYVDAYKQYLDAACPVPEDGIKHFVYFARDRDAIKDHALLDNSRFTGAQIMYSWAMLEPTRDEYDFSTIREDYEYLKAHGKRLFIQLQDATFDPRYKGVPAYLAATEYDGGMVPQVNDEGHHEGWVAKRWNPKVQERFALLLMALGKEFDGRIEGINLQETAISMHGTTDETYSAPVYLKAIKARMKALKSAFPASVTMLYANFMPDEWLPWEDKGYLRSVYAFGEEIGVGLGAPDLMPQRKGQLNHALAVMHEGDFSVPLGIAVQDGNYTGMTGADFSGNDIPEELATAGRKNLVPLLHAFASDFLGVSYIFWVNQEPYFEEDVLSCFPE